MSKEFFEALLEIFAREAEAGLSRIILLVLDNAGLVAKADHSELISRKWYDNPIKALLTELLADSLNRTDSRAERCDPTYFG